MSIEDNMTLKIKRIQQKDGQSLCLEISNLIDTEVFNDQSLNVFSKIKYSMVSH